MTAQCVRWGLLSTARINERLIRSIRTAERSELVAVASRDSTRALDYAAEWSIPRAHGSYEALLQDPEIDCVYISLPNGLHTEWAVKAAQAKKHTLCEKPLAVSVEGVQRMAAAARENRVIIQEATMMRFHRQLHTVRDLLAEQSIGDIRFVRAVFSIDMQRAGDIRFDPEIGGGCLWDLGSYPVSFTRAVLQEDPIEANASQVLSDTGVDVIFSGQLRFPSGAFLQFVSTFQGLPHQEIQILGTRGTIELDQPYTTNSGSDGHVRVARKIDRPDTTTFGDIVELDVETLTFEKFDAYLCEVESMERSILEGTPVVISLNDSEANVRTIQALYQSACEGRRVEL